MHSDLLQENWKQNIVTTKILSSHWEKGIFPAIHSLHSDELQIASWFFSRLHPAAKLTDF